MRIALKKENRPSGGVAIYFDSLKNHIGQIFKDYDQVLCIMALGIVVRMIAPYIEHKSKDPAVVVMDEVGHHVISFVIWSSWGRQRMDAVHFAGHRCGPSYYNRYGCKRIASA